MLQEALVLIIQRELCHPKSARKVSGLSRNELQQVRRGECNISACAVTCAQNQWQNHYTNLKHLLQLSIAHKINAEILKEKSQCFSSNLRTKSMIKYISYKNLRNLLRQLLSCKISYKIQLKNSKYLPPQSLEYEVYRKQENEVKDLLPKSRRTRKINDKMQQRLVKSLFSQSLLREINDKMY